MIKKSAKRQNIAEISPEIYRRRDRSRRAMVEPVGLALGPALVAVWSEGCREPVPSSCVGRPSLPKGEGLRGWEFERNIHDLMSSFSIAL